MFTKISLIISILILVSLPGCAAKTATPSAANPTQNNPQSPEPGSTPSEEYSADNYQMLPLISGKMANVTLDALADGTTQQLKVGEVMAVILESNPSTGYSWVATITDPSVLVQMGEPQYQQPFSGSTPAVGAPGTQTFLFQAIAAGTSTVTLDYLRSFETNVAPQKTVTIKVVVSK